MADLTKMHISAIIPAFNEEQTIGAVLECVVASGLANEVIVVNDGSTDLTGEIACRYNVRVITLTENRGKGNAMAEGIENSTGEVVLFIDSDLVGLKKEHISLLIQPVMTGLADMTVGKFTTGRILTTLAHSLTPFLSGQRAFRKSALEGCIDLQNTGYGVETAITKHFRRKGYRILQVKLENLTHIMKEEKMGLVPGLLHRLKMYHEILIAIFHA